jgi:hypothetical protein
MESLQFLRLVKLDEDKRKTEEAYNEAIACGLIVCGAACAAA